MLRKKLVNRLTALTVLVVVLILSGSVPVWAQKTDVKVRLPNDVVWARGADEYRFCTQQAYDNAQSRLRRLVRGEKSGTWCVVFDMDETLFSNVMFQVNLSATGEKYTQNKWYQWCDRGEATLLSGAMDFCKLVRKLGGKVVIITNRHGKEKEGTIRNLKESGLPFDALILRKGPYENDNSKVARRKDLERGTLKVMAWGKTLPPLKILMRAGDQVHDFYDPCREKSSVMIKRFARDFIIIPNPMYGSWTSKPYAYVDRVTSTGDMNLDAVVGQQLTVALKSNPTTGYRWEMTKPVDNAILKMDGYKFEAPDGAMLGKSGKEVWKFRALSAGKTTLYFQYVRPWEKDAKPQKVRVIHVNVR